MDTKRSVLKKLIFFRGRQANFFKCANRKSASSWVYSALAYPQISRYASPQISNLQSFITYPQIGQFLPNTAQLCLKTVLYFVFVNVFLCTDLNHSITVYAMFLWRKNTYLQICGSFKSASHKKLGYA